MAGKHSYGQKSKAKARRVALRRAVELVTSRRDAATVVAKDYVRRVRRAKLSSGNAYDAQAVSALRKKDIDGWERYRRSAIGKRKPHDITVAYLAGPEPANDLEELLRLGVRPENIWAFENNAAEARAGHEQLVNMAIRGVKFLHINIEDFFAGTSRRFDIIYLDACASLPAASRMLVTLFRHAALAPLGVLVTNFSKPDEANADLLEKHVFAVAAYLYGKDFMDLKKGGWTDSASAHGYVMAPGEILPEEDDEDAPRWEDQLFQDEVRRRFAHYYGSFVTRHIMDIAALIAPMARLAQTRFWDQLSSRPIAEAAKRGRDMLIWPDWPEEDGIGDDFDTGGRVPKGGEAISENGTHSLLKSFELCGAYGSLTEQEGLPKGIRRFLAAWMSHLRGKDEGKLLGADLAAAYYGLRADTDLQSEALRRVTEYQYREMAFLCDVPNSDIGFYPAIAQLAHPSHCNVREARRYRYTAKATEMYLDVLPFDECRYVYDWQSVFSLVPGDWADESDQLIFRFAIDAVAKATRWYQSDFLHGCHSIGTDGRFPADELRPRRNLSAGRRKLPARVGKRKKV
jgi:hypothetical protein